MIGEGSNDTFGKKNVFTEKLIKIGWEEKVVNTGPMRFPHSTMYGNITNTVHAES